MTTPTAAVAHADQWAAAIAQAARSVPEEPDHEMTPALAEALDRWRTDLADRVQVCGHLHRGPRPAYGFLPMRGVIACAQCVPDLYADYLARPHECDLCGTPDALALLSARLRLGAVIIYARLCPPCGGRGWQ